MPISTAMVSALKTSIGRKLPRKCLGDVWDVPATCLRRPSSAGNRLEEAHARAVSRRRRKRRTRCRAEEASAHSRQRGRDGASILVVARNHGRSAAGGRDVRRDREA